jgi:hypothetical protein
MGWYKPEPSVFAKEKLTMLHKSLLSAPEFLHVVDVSLVVLNRLNLLLQQLPCKHQK